MTQKQAPTHKSITDVLDHAGSALGYLMGRVEQLNQWNQKLYTLLPTPESKHAQIANFEQGKLTIAVDSANWITKLRYKTPDLIKALKKMPEFRSLNEIRFIVQLKGTNLEQPTPPTAPLSTATRTLLQETAKGLEDSPLKEALKTLSEK